MTLLDHTMMRVTDLDRAVDWYRAHIGLEELGRWEAKTFTNLYLSPPDRSDEGAMLELTYNHDGRDYTSGDAWSHIALRVSDLETTIESLRSRGVEVTWPIRGEEPRAAVTDPDGHQLELVEQTVGAESSLAWTAVETGNLDQAVGWYVHKFGLMPTEQSESAGRVYCDLQPAGASDQAMSLRLIETDNVQAVGDSWGHISFRVSDLISNLWPTLMARGAADYRSPEECAPFDYEGTTTGIRHTTGLYAFTKDPDGRQIELLEV